MAPVLCSSVLVDVTRMGSRVSNHACSFTQFWKPILFDHGGVEDRILRFTHANFLAEFFLMLLLQQKLALDDQHHGQQLWVQLWVLPVMQEVSHDMFLSPKMPLAAF